MDGHCELLAAYSSYLSILSIRKCTNSTKHILSENIPWKYCMPYFE